MSDIPFSNEDLYKSIFQEKQKIRIYLKKVSFNKIITVIKFEGQGDKSDLKKLASEMKSKLACGGTYSENTIELQGNHIEESKKILISKGYPSDSIEINKLL